MIKLLVIADDFTGALDTGVQFSNQGISTKIILYRENEKIFSDEYAEEDVLVIDAETRHLMPDKAAYIIRNIILQSRENKISHVYKKTDSALRGNIGAELSAALEAAECEVLPFIPAFPEMGRTTEQGIHYINGEPVSTSVFGKDPFEPVCDDAVADILHRQTDVNIVVISSEQKELPKEKGIWVFDAGTEADLKQIADKLFEDNHIALMAGCAGFAKFLPKLLKLTSQKTKKVKLNKKIFAVCGSVNPITQAQLNEGEKNGYPRIYLVGKEKMETGFWESTEGQDKTK